MSTTTWIEVPEERREKEEGREEYHKGLEKATLEAT
jgi:hypothetical protein